MVTLNARLQSLKTGQRQQEALIDLFTVLADTAYNVSRIISAGGELSDTIGVQNSDGDNQKALDVIADDEFLGAVRASGVVAAYCSEEQDSAVVIEESAPLVVAIDPLDGSSNIDVNVSIGTIISVLPNPGGDLQQSAMQVGKNQLAAAFFVYGPQTTLYLTTGNGTDLYRMDPATGVFLLVEEGIEIPAETSEYAINASNARQWFTPVQRYVSDLLLGDEGPRERNFNMRWIGSLVADAGRIFNRGGVFLYPGDRRPKYESGRLRLIYEANPVAFLTEQAGGAATDGVTRILEKVPAEIHERTALVFGSKTEVHWVGSYEAEVRQGLDLSPLFSNRNLFRS
ncbi:MAG: class 1 fructose-bisphosphatase [Gammaproteobacteria bacterium]|nr:class 1 fructose-bisphosphatase [Gammaproteobacteria bacterium]